MTTSISAKATHKIRGSECFVRVLWFTIVFACSLFPSTPVLAHSPVFPAGNHTLATAYQLDDAAKSWAIYTSLEQAGQADYYAFSCSVGEQIELSLITPENPVKSGFLPSIALLIPDQINGDSLPSGIDIPTGYGVMVEKGSVPSEVTYEPFAPGWYYELVHLTIAAPTAGTYFVVVYDAAQTTGKYGLPLGYLETFTFLEIVLIPYHLLLVYRWEGQSVFGALLPFIGVIIVGGFIIIRRNKNGQTPRSLVNWLADFGGLAFLGSAAITIYQMLLALSKTGLRSEAFFTLVFVILAIVLGLLTLRLSSGNESPLAFWKRVALITIAIFGLLVWAGLYIGPLLVFLAAVLPSNIGKKKYG
jgi:hypothetical protein